METDPKTIDFLNGYLSIELTGHKQYLLHSTTCGRWGLPRLAARQRAYSVEETSHAFEVAERLLFLEGTPSLADARPIRVVTRVEQQLALDRDLVGFAIGRLREAVQHCTHQRDAVSRALFQRMLVDEEDHLHWVETELGLIDRLGLPGYLRAQLGHDG